MIITHLLLSCLLTGVHPVPNLLHALHFAAVARQQRDGQHVGYGDGHRPHHPAAGSRVPAELLLSGERLSDQSADVAAAEVRGDASDVRGREAAVQDSAGHTDADGSAQG